MQNTCKFIMDKNNKNRAGKRAEMLTPESGLSGKREKRHQNRQSNWIVLFPLDFGIAQYHSFMRRIAELTIGN